MTSRLWLIVGMGLAAVAALIIVAVLWWALSPPGQGTSTSPNPPPSGPPWYEDVTAGSGLDFTYRNGAEAEKYTILESLGGGVALIDYDRDGLLDIFLTGGGSLEAFDRKQIAGRPCKLFRNLGGWKFQDVTEQTGLAAVSWWYTHGAAVADYDRDGWPDLAVGGYGRVALFRNEAGDGGRKFVDVTEKVGLADDSWSASLGWGDIDGDGYPDLYVCHYVDWSFANNPPCKGQAAGVTRDVCAPQQFKPLVHALFHNDKGQRFHNIAAEQHFEAKGRGMGVAVADLNDDQRPDVYVANDAGNNFLFWNRGGKLEEGGFDAGAAVDDTATYNGSMGVDVGDYDGSGRASLWVTNFQGEMHALYRNLGREFFDHVSRPAGIGKIGQQYVGFGTGFVDADNDGWLDIVVSNGHVLHHPAQGSTHKQRPVLFHNVGIDGRRAFRDVSDRGGPYFRTPVIGRGLAVGDLDNDGRPDLVISHSNTPVAVLRNVAGAETPARWLGVKLVGRDGRDVVGSTVILETDGRALTRFVRGGGSYLSAGDPRMLFGLGQSGKPRRVTVKWSWGQTQSWDGVETGAYWELHEGVTEPRRWP